MVHIQIWLECLAADVIKHAARRACHRCQAGVSLASKHPPADNNLSTGFGPTVGGR